jgi:predicted DsbA family dithiol-disulfide isomerase
MAMPVAIDIVSDFVCPWCFIGKSHLAEALALVRQEHPQARFRCTWLPFFLNPGTPSEGVPYRKFMADKFGGESRVLAVQQRVADAGREAGVHFNFARIALRPNTLRAHRLIHRAQSSGRAPEDSAKLVDRLFAAYFQRGEDIGDIGVLADIAAESGDERTAAIAYLQSEEGLGEILALNKQVNESGVSGVPFFVLAKRLGVAGAQKADVLAEAIRQAMAPP